MPDDPKEARRQEILVAALTAFTEKGYDRTSMDDVVRISGLSKGTLYWYFDNKQALFAALVKMVFEQFMTLFETIAEEAKTLTPPEKLRALLAGSAVEAALNPQFVSLYMDFFIQASQQEPVRQALKEPYARYSDLIAGIIEEGIASGIFRPVDTQAVARGIAGAVDGVMAQSLLGLGWDIREPLNTLTDTLIRGLLKGE